MPSNSVWIALWVCCIGNAGCKHCNLDAKLRGSCRCPVLFTCIRVLDVVINVNAGALMLTDASLCAWDHSRLTVCRETPPLPSHPPASQMNHNMRVTIQPVRAAFLSTTSPLAMLGACCSDSALRRCNSAHCSTCLGNSTPSPSSNSNPSTNTNNPF